MRILIHGTSNRIGVLTTKHEGNTGLWAYFAGDSGERLAIRAAEVLLHGEGGLTLRGFVLQPTPMDGGPIRGGSALYRHETLTCTILP